MHSSVTKTSKESTTASNMSSKVIRILLLTTFFPLFVCSAPVSTSTEPDDAVFKIVGGRGSVRGQWPWQAVVILINEGSSGLTLCGGTLVHPQWVLTSAHCIRGYKMVNVVMGIWNISDIHEGGRTFYRSEKLVMHPCFHKDDLTGTNIGLIKLNGRHQADNVLCLPNNYYEDWRNLQRGDTIRNCVATGFGKTYSKNLPSILQQVTFPNVSRHRCEEVYGSTISHDKICAYGRNGEDTCYGDIGGPLVCYSNAYSDSCRGQYLAAVTLAGSTTCGDEDMPGLYTAVFPHVEWIRSTIGLNSSTSVRTAETESGTTSNIDCSNPAVEKFSSTTNPAQIKVEVSNR